VGVGFLLKGSVAVCGASEPEYGADLDVAEVGKVAVLIAWVRDFLLGNVDDWGIPTNGELANLVDWAIGVWSAVLAEGFDVLS